jgi:exonuclease SbcD
MKILHTSDWHLGRRLEGESLFEPHEHFLTWLVDDLIPQEQPDLLVIAGDIFDRPVPPTEAIELYEKTLARISKLGVRILISAGNHDNRVRLGMHSTFLDEMGVHFRTRLHQIADPVRIESDDFVLLAYGIPYLEPDVDAGVNEHQWDVEATTPSVMAEALRLIREDLSERSKTESKPIRTLVASHAWVTGGAGSESERNVKVGTLGQASADLFAGIDYVAMGHLHGPQQVKSSESLVFYSGSPIPFSFSERDHEKRVLVVTVDADGVKEENVKSHAVPQVRKMQQFKDTVEALLSDKYPASDDWIKVIVTDEKVPVGFFEILKNRKFKFLLQMIPEKSIDGIVNRTGEGVLLQNLSHEDVTKRFIKRVTRKEELDPEMNAAIESCCHEVEQGSVSI